MHWSSISNNPNLPEVVAMRAARVSNARRAPVPDGVTYLCDLARGKRVIDVGVVNHMAQTRDDPEWLHGRLAAVASECLGVDVLPEGVAELRQQGYNVVLCDITSDAASVEGPFDLVVCGELIEHVGNPGGLFTAARHLLAPGGALVLTTPNPYYLGRAMRHVFRRANENVDHVTLLFPSGVAEFADRAGMQLSAYRGVLAEASTLKRKVLMPFRSIVMAMTSEEAACDSLIYECTHAQS